MSTSRSSETSNCCSRCSRRAVGIVCGFLEQRRGPGAERLPSLAAGTERCRGRLSPASLRARLDGTPVIVRTNPHDGVLRRDATHRRQQRESRPGPTDATTTSNLDTLLTSALPRLTQCHRRVLGRVRQPEVAPSHPPIPPPIRFWVTAEQIDREVRGRHITARLARPGATDASPIRQLHHTRLVGPSAHTPTLTAAQPTPRHDGPVSSAWRSRPLRTIAGARFFSRRS